MTFPLHFEASTFAALQWTSIIQLLALDLTLGLNNVVGIAPICAAIPKGERIRVLLFASLAAFILRILMLSAAQLLTLLPHLSLLAGIYLCFLGYRLVTDRRRKTRTIRAGVSPEEGAPTRHRLVLRIAVVDASLSIDNVAALVAAAHTMVAASVVLHPLANTQLMGNATMVTLIYCCAAVAFSIPLIMTCAVGLAPLLNRTAWLTWLGAALLVWTGLSVAAEDPWCSEALQRFLG